MRTSPRETSTRHPAPTPTLKKRARRPRAARGAEEKSGRSERRRLGQELHDGPAQLLVVALLQVRAASARVSQGTTPEAELENLRALIRMALDDVRALSHDLGEVERPVLPLRAALVELARRSSNGMIAVEVRGEPAALEDLCPVAAGELLRIAQSALGNVIRHTCASRCTMLLSQAGDRLRLQIDDDGEGFNPLAAGVGMGLSGIRERVTAIGGTCSLDTALGRGTSICVEVPARAVPVARAVARSVERGATAFRSGSRDA